jgi:CheY-like chemotaxis protein
MKGNIFLVQWDAASANERAESLRRVGWHVEVETENGGRAYRHIRTSVPDVVVLDLARKPSHGREVGSALRDLRGTSALPVVCIEEGNEARESTREKIPDAIFAASGDLAVTLDLVASDRRARSSAPPSSRRRRVALPIEDGLERR